MVAALAGLFGYQADWLSLVLVLLAILAGVFYFESDDLVNNGIRYLVFVTVYTEFNAIRAVGTYLTSRFAAIAMFWAAVLRTALVVHFVMKYLVNKR